MHMIHNSSMSPYEVRLASGDILDVSADGALFGIIDENMLPRYKAFPQFEVRELTEEEVEAVLEKFAEAGRTPEQGLAVRAPTPDPVEIPENIVSGGFSTEAGTSPAPDPKSPPSTTPAAPAEAVASTITKLTPTLEEKPVAKVVSPPKAASSKVQSK